MLLSGPPGHPLDPNPLSLWTNPLAVSRLETFGNTLDRANYSEAPENVVSFLFCVDCLSKARCLVIVGDGKTLGFDCVAFRLRGIHLAQEVAIPIFIEPPLLVSAHLVPTFRLYRVL